MLYGEYVKPGENEKTGMVHCTYCTLFNINLWYTFNTSITDSISCDGLQGRRPCWSSEKKTKSAVVATSDREWETGTNAWSKHAKPQTSVCVSGCVADRVQPLSKKEKK